MQLAPVPRSRQKGEQGRGVFKGPAQASLLPSQPRNCPQDAELSSNHSPNWPLGSGLPPLKLRLSTQHLRGPAEASTSGQLWACFAGQF